MKYAFPHPGAVIALILVSPFLTQCASQKRPTPSAHQHGAVGPTQRGLASYYSVRTNGRTTASGVPLSDSANTAAHRSLPFGTLVRVTNMKNGRSQVVRITDRGPFIRGRIIDVSAKTAKELDMVRSGVVPVVIEVLQPPNRA